jgi:hypothetical protein
VSTRDATRGCRFLNPKNSQNDHRDDLDAMNLTHALALARCKRTRVKREGPMIVPERAA